MKKANPVVIGSFVIASLILFVVGVLVFSSGKLFTRTHILVAVFPGAVKGLRVGNPVEFRGVRIGSVKDIKLLYDEKNSKVVVPVYLDIDTSMIMGIDHQKLRVHNSDKKWRSDLIALIDAGLKAQLDMQSLVTGQMLVTLDFRPDVPVKMTAVDQQYLEIPTIPSIVTTIVETLKELPLEDMVNKLAGAADGINRLINSRKVLDILNNTNLAIVKAHELLENISAQVQPLSGSASATLSEIRLAISRLEKQSNLTLKQFSTLSQNLDHSLNKTLDSADSAFKSADVSFKSADDFINPDSPLRADFEDALAELSAAARSFRILTEYLERHPDSLIKGKKF